MHRTQVLMHSNLLVIFTHATTHTLTLLNILYIQILQYHNIYSDLSSSKSEVSNIYMGKIHTDDLSCVSNPMYSILLKGKLWEYIGSV